MNNETDRIFSLNRSASQRVENIEMPGTTQLNLEDVEDFSNVCRICATVTEFVIPIFSGEGLQNNLAGKIHNHLPIKVSEQDLLPLVVCCQCANTLMAWHELVQCCVQANVAIHTRASMLEPERKAIIPGPSEPGPSGEHKFKFKEDDASETIEMPVFGEPVSPPPVPTRVCEYCGSEYPETAYKKHLIDEHCDLVFLCDECDSFIDRRELIIHMSIHAAHYTTTRIPSLVNVPKEEHETKVEVESTIETGTATEGSPENEDRDRDEGTNEFSDHSDAESNFGPLPESVFEAIEDTRDNDEREPAADLGPPARSSNNRKVRKCPICGKTYTASSSYFYHLKHAHGHGHGERAECAACGKRFATRANLAQHAAVHTGERAHQCRQCGKRFAARAGLYIHEQGHAGDKRYSCATCRRAFRWRAQLARHVQRHARDAPHACAACARAFKVRSDLVRHARTHLAAPRHACARCPLHFAQLRYLKVHTERHHPAPAPAAPAPTLRRRGRKVN